MKSFSFALLTLVIPILILWQNCGEFEAVQESSIQSTGGNEGVRGTPPPIENLDKFNDLMETYGRRFCNKAEIEGALNPSNIQEGNVWYYDGTLVYHNMANYTGDSPWFTCSEYVDHAYRQWVNGLNLVPGDYRPLSGWRLFPHGLKKHFDKTNDTQDSSAITRLATQSAFLSNWDTFSVADLPKCAGSRETAYLINAFLTAKDLGVDPGPKLTQVIDWALGHLDQWFVAKTCLSKTDESLEMQPFMVGLTTEALLFAYEKTSDANLRTRILTKVETAMDELWTIAWRESDQAMISNTAHETDWGTWPVVNTLIGATYAWLWQVTGKDRHRDRADKMWNGCMKMDFPNQIWSGKQYSQIFRRAFDYLKWRGSPPGTFNPPTRY